MWTLIFLMVQAAQASVWDGVYTAEQAERGKATYAVACASCHKEDLTGGRAKALVGSPFWQSWGEDTLSSLYKFVRETMPRNNPGTLSEHEYADIVAHILQMNSYPAGTRELTRETVSAIQVVGRNGRGPVPNFSLVRVVGCLEEQSAGKWALTRASEPVRSRNPSPSVEGERELSQSSVLGDTTYELIDTFTYTNGHHGEKVEIKGLLIRGTPNRLNYSSMQTFAASCP